MFYTNKNTGVYKMKEKEAMAAMKESLKKISRLASGRKTVMGYTAFVIGSIVMLVVAFWATPNF